MTDRPVRLGTVHIVDDDAAMRDALRVALQAAGLKVHAYDGPAALMAAFPMQSPAMILLDVRLENASGIEFQAQLRAQGVQVPVVFMSGQSRPQEIVDGFRQGAKHFLVKPFGTEQLLAAVDEALAHDSRRHEDERRVERVRDRLQLLTPREREVMRLMLRGYPNREIAAVLGTTPGTVKLQRASVLSKMQAQGMADLDQLLDREHIERLLEEG